MGEAVSARRKRTGEDIHRGENPVENFIHRPPGRYPELATVLCWIEDFKSRRRKKTQLSSR
jgi:hypothetical protein